MLVFPNAKINIGLYVTEKRPDGYHNIETVFYPLSLTDVLEITESKSKTKFAQTGINVDTLPENNLVFRAYKLIQNDFNISNLKIFLHKNIPFGAGLGGGSADAAFMLKLLNQYFDLNLTSEKLKQYAEQLGSDCAFFIDNIPAYATGKGNELNAIDLELNHLWIYLVKPNISVSTALAYADIVPNLPSFDLRLLKNLPISEWKSTVFNVFEKGIFVAYPEIAEIKQKLYDSGAVYASMSGSGSAVFGLFEQKPTKIAGFEEYFSYISTLPAKI